ncbi:hypothetical protein K493DRAFT_406261, partial [Basidiobolus meristosporus CBS 931.73]
MIVTKYNVTIPSCDPFGQQQNPFNHTGVLVKALVDCKNANHTFIDIPTKIQLSQNVTKTMLVVRRNGSCLDDQQLLEKLSTIGLPNSVVLLYPISPGLNVCTRTFAPSFANNPLVIGQAIIPQAYVFSEYNATGGLMTLQVSQETNPWNTLVNSQLYSIQYWVFFALKVTGASILLFYILKVMFRGFFEKNIRTALAFLMMTYLLATAFFPWDALDELIFVDPVKAIFEYDLLRSSTFKVYVVLAYLLGIVSCYLLTVTWCRVMMLVHN